MVHRKLPVAGPLVAALAFSVAARASNIIELADAGDMPVTAQVTPGSGNLAFITGSLSDGVDVDMFAIYVADPAAFSATTDVPQTAITDTQLWLFDAGGMGVMANDDITNGGGQYNGRSRVTAGGLYGPAAPGVYYLAVSGWDRDPHSATGAIFNDDQQYTGTVGPTGPGGGLALSTWDSDGNQNGGVGNYRIRLTGATHVPAVVPEPAPLVLVALGLGLVTSLLQREPN
jgi:hypothetical protein